MVNTLILYDLPHRRDRARLESLLRERGFVWLFPHARWSAKGLNEHSGLSRAIRARLRHAAYRILIVQIPSRHRIAARWLGRECRRST
jgi:hypothetical protein